MACSFLASAHICSVSNAHQARTSFRRVQLLHETHLGSSGAPLVQLQLTTAYSFCHSSSLVGLLHLSNEIANSIMYMRECGQTHERLHELSQQHTHAALKVAPGIFPVDSSSIESVRTAHAAWYSIALTEVWARIPEAMATTQAYPDVVEASTTTARYFT